MVLIVTLLQCEADLAFVQIGATYVYNNAKLSTAAAFFTIYNLTIKNKLLIKKIIHADHLKLIILNLY